jgi:NNP family nitrate/nitrite transporter-like MFS transporter
MKNNYMNTLQSPLSSAYHHLPPAPDQEQAPPLHTQETSLVQRHYALRTDPFQQDRALEIRFFQFKRPHMRAFHLAWISFFLAFFGWFAVPPLMPTIKKELQLTKDQVYTSNIVAVSSTILARILIGPFCDRFGPRKIQAFMLFTGAFPVACTALVQNAMGFYFMRFLTGLVGAIFVSTSTWTSTMFANEIVGTANAFTAGWGNLGGGVTFLVMPLLFDLFHLHGGWSSDLSWRLALLVPSFCMLCTGIIVFFYADDCPQGNQVQKAIPSNSMHELWMAFKNPSTWILALHYGVSFGVELQLENILGLYFYEEFKRPNCIDNTKDGGRDCHILSQSTAGLMASLSGLMNLFTRWTGGYLSDQANKKWSFQGRVYIQGIYILGSGIFLILFSRLKTLVSAGITLVIASFFIQGACGTTFAIVPSILPFYIGAVSGFAGAGGNIGAMLWGFLLKHIQNIPNTLLYIGIIVACSSVLAVGIKSGRSAF